MNNRNIKLAAAVGMLAAPFVGLGYLYRRPLPKVKGKIRVGGYGHSPLCAPVEIIRDRWGVPHIYAENQDDLFFAQGYVHAQDRLWQMELNRRIGRGRLSEIFGELTFTTDRLIRTIGLARAAAQDMANASEEELRLLEAYARGVNSFLGANDNRLPLEFTLLRFKPEPWQPLDSYAWGKVLSWGLSSNWDAELVRGALIGKLGAERAAQLQGEYNRENPIVIPDQTYAEMIWPLLEQFQAAEKWLPIQGTGGMSNNWVVDGAKSTTGQPLLANDPHLSLQMPALWYENHLMSPEFQVTGISLPGTPGVVIGHNANIAWGMTVSFADTQDLYVEKPNPADGSQFEFQGSWERARVIREEILVKGETAPRKVDVTITRHGPIIDSWLPETVKPAPPALALRWTGHEVSHLYRSVLKLNQAKNWDEFADALEQWTEPSLNFVYADRAGNIGYYMAGKVPIRRGGIGASPVPGWSGEYEWTGWIPHADLPHAFNPAQHFIVTANNRVVGKEYPYFLTHETMNGFRARRITELLNEKEKVDADDFARIQIDQFSRPAQTFCGLLLKLAPEILKQPVLDGSRIYAINAMKEIEAWDCELNAESVAGAIYEVVQHFAMRRIFQPWLGEMTEHMMGVGFHPLLAPNLSTYHDRTYLTVQRILIEDEDEWFRGDEGEPLARVEILALAMKDAIQALREMLGDDMANWRWGALHKAWFNHPLGTQKPLDRIFNRGPFPYGGDTSTVWQAAFIPKFPIPPEHCGTASWRQIIDLQDWDASRAIHTTGQSGHPASRHYDDMIPMWLNGLYHPMLWSRERIEEEKEAELRLEP